MLVSSTNRNHLCNNMGDNNSNKLHHSGRRYWRNQIWVHKRRCINPSSNLVNNNSGFRDKTSKNHLSSRILVQHSINNSKKCTNLHFHCKNRSKKKIKVRCGNLSSKILGSRHRKRISRWGKVECSHNSKGINRWAWVEGRQNSKFSSKVGNSLISIIWLDRKWAEKGSKKVLIQEALVIWIKTSRTSHLNNKSLINIHRIFHHLKFRTRINKTPDNKVKRWLNPREWTKEYNQSSKEIDSKIKDHKRLAKNDFKINLIFWNLVKLIIFKLTNLTFKLFSNHIL